MASIPNDITWNGGKCTWLYLHNRKQRFPLGPKTLPLVGNILDFQVRSVRVLAVRTADFWRYGDHPYWHFAHRAALQAGTGTLCGRKILVTSRFRNCWGPAPDD